jgi:uncharacterized membrane protein YphA (DoxX/SURF4 family)
MPGTISAVAAVLLGGVFLLSSVAKLASVEQWRTQSADLGVAAPVAAVVPWAEVALAAWLVSQFLRTAAALIAVALVLAFTALLVTRIAQGRRPPCACFGNLRPRPIGWSDVARNMVFVAVGVVAAL